MIHHMRKSVLNQEVNFILSIFLIGSSALLAIVLMMNAAEMENPISSHLVAIAAEGDL